jgi:DNA-binding NtrC family response regulator
MTQRERTDASDGTGLAGAHLLVAEDDFIISIELESTLLEAGAESVGVCRTVKDALLRAGDGRFSAAILDVRLGRETVIPLARLLTQRGIPFVFYTGQVDLDSVRVEWPQCRIISKPAQSRTIVHAIVEALKR